MLKIQSLKILPKKLHAVVHYKNELILARIKFHLNEKKKIN
jgi:hypothetical protein